MSDDGEQPDINPADDAGGQSRPSPTRRARRIGGRVGPARPDTPADDDAHAEPVSVTKSPPPAEPTVPTWLRWAPAGILSAGAIAMAVLLLVFSHGVWWGKPSSASVRDEVMAAAKTCIVNTNTYKYTALDKYSKAVDECTTGALTGQIRKTIKTVIKKYAPTLKANQTCEISRGGLESVSPHGKQWTVLLFGQLSVVNTNEPNGRTDPFAAQVQMEKVDGKWVMSGLKTVSTPL